MYIIRLIPFPQNPLDAHESESRKQSGTGSLSFFFTSTWQKSPKHIAGGGEGEDSDRKT